MHRTCAEGHVLMQEFLHGPCVNGLVTILSIDIPQWTDERKTCKTLLIYQNDLFAKFWHTHMPVRANTVKCDFGAGNIFRFCFFRLGVRVVVAVAQNSEQINGPNRFTILSHVWWWHNPDTEVNIHQKHWLQIVTICRGIFAQCGTNDGCKYKARIHTRVWRPAGLWPSELHPSCKHIFVFP